MKNIAIMKLKRFLTAHARKYLLLTGILYVGIVSILVFPISFSENVMAWFGGYVACPIICIFLTRTLVTAYLSVTRQFNALKEAGMLEQIAQDFTSAEMAMGGNLYIGKLGLYGKGSNGVSLYSEMVHLYSVLSDRRGRNPRDLRYENADGSPIRAVALLEI